MIGDRHVLDAARERVPELRGLALSAMWIDRFITENGKGPYLDME